MAWFWAMIWVGLVWLGLFWWARQWLASKQKLVELVLMPPLGGDRTIAATADLFIALSKLMAQRSLLAKIFGFHPTWQLLIKARADKGCQFIWQLPRQQRLAAERLLIGYWPYIRIKSQKAYAYNLKTVARLKPAKSLENQNENETAWGESDPAGYLTSQLGETAKKGVVAYGIKLQSTSTRRPDLTGWVLLAVSRLTNAFLTLFQPATSSGGEVATTSTLPEETPKKSISFASNISLLAEPRLVKTGATRSLLPALGLMGLKPSRLPGGAVLSPTQVATLWHFPNSAVAPADNLTHSLSKTLPLPTALLPEPGPDDLIIGTSNHRGSFGKPIYLTPQARQRHVYIVGGTGTGKTTMIKDQAIQDMRAGRGVGVIDPHGDLATELLDYIPSSRVDDLIYFDPDNFDQPIGINLLEIPAGLDHNELARQKDLVTESVVSVLRKLFAVDGEGGHRIEYILRNSIQTALELPNPTLFTIYDLLQNPQFRRRAIAEISNPHLKLFWQQELGKAGEYQRVKMTAGVTAKIGRFLFSTPTQLTFGQVRSTIDFLKIMDDSSILICNLSRGVLGEDTSRLFGSTILAKIQLAALTRARQSFASRQPFYLYVDEFQNFATTSFVEMLSESRKYQVLLTIAEQSTQQQFDQKLIEVILANVGTVVAFRSGSPTDAQLLAPLLEPFVEPVGLMSLPAYQFYARVGTLNTVEATSGVTRLLTRVSSLKT